MAEQDPARQWLRENGYEDIAGLIDAFIAEWKAAGKRTRRNWWEMLAGGSQGKPRTINGKNLPVLKAAQLRQGLPVQDPTGQRHWPHSAGRECRKAGS